MIPTGSFTQLQPEKDAPADATPSFEDKLANIEAVLIELICRVGKRKGKGKGKRWQYEHMHRISYGYSDKKGVRRLILSICIESIFGWLKICLSKSRWHSWDKPLHCKIYYSNYNFWHWVTSKLFLKYCKISGQVSVPNVGMDSKVLILWLETKV